MLLPEAACITNGKSQENLRRLTTLQGIQFFPEFRDHAFNHWNWLILARDCLDVVREKTLRFIFATEDARCTIDLKLRRLDNCMDCRSLDRARPAARE
jgi:hypothetical protein